MRPGTLLTGHERSHQRSIYVVESMLDDRTALCWVAYFDGQYYFRNDQANHTLYHTPLQTYRKIVVTDYNPDIIFNVRNLMRGRFVRGPNDILSGHTHMLYGAPGTGRSSGLLTGTPYSIPATEHATVTHLDVDDVILSMGDFVDRMPISTLINTLDGTNVRSTRRGRSGQ